MRVHEQYAYAHTLRLPVIVVRLFIKTVEFKEHDLISSRLFMYPILLVSVLFICGLRQPWPAHAEPLEFPPPILVAQQQDFSNQTLLDKAKTNFEIQEFDTALDALESLIEREPPSAILQEAYFLQAAILRTTNQESEAASIMEQLLDEFPMSPLANETRLLLGQLYLNLEKPQTRYHRPSPSIRLFDRSRHTTRSPNTNSRGLSLT